MGFLVCFNIGPAIIESEEIASQIEAGDEVAIDFDKGVITNCTKNQQFNTTPFPPFIQEIINANGYLNWISKNKANA